MASTSTNKQPLLVDNVLHVAVDMNPHKVSVNTTTPGNFTNNTAAKIIDTIGGDGCIIECMYTISRSTDAFNINLYLSTNGDYLRPEQSVFIGQITSATGVYNKSEVDDLPTVLAPVARVGSSQLRALYVPRGSALWAACEVAVLEEIQSDAPILGVQGGRY